MDTPVFPLPYLFEVDKDTTYATRTIVFESQKKQVQQLAVNPMKKWKISCKGSNEDRKTLEDFQASVRGNTQPFFFFDENNEQQLVRFSEPSLPIKLIREFSRTEITKGKVVGFTAEITVEVAL